MHVGAFVIHVQHAVARLVVLDAGTRLAAAHPF